MNVAFKSEFCVSICSASFQPPSSEASSFAEAGCLGTGRQRCLRYGRNAKAGFKSGKSRGFTLIELMVVLVLMAIMAAMIVPEMKGTFEDALLRSTSRDLVSVLNLAYSRAVAINQVHRVRFEPASGKYFIETRVRGGERGSDFIPVRDVAGSEGKLDQRITVGIKDSIEDLSETPIDPTVSTSEIQLAQPESENTISFYPDGTADRRAIELEDREGFRLSLQINPITARVRIVETERH